MILSTALVVSLQLNLAAHPAAPLKTARTNTNPAIQSELPRRGALGVGFAPVPDDQRANVALKPGEGLVVVNVISGLTGYTAGLKSGDIILSLNNKPVAPSTIGVTIRETPAGQALNFKVVRDGKPLELRAPLVEKPRDPGNGNFDVVYSHIVSNGLKMRTIITKPKKPGKHPGFMFIQGFSPISYDYTLATATGDVTSLDGPLLFDFANRNFVTIRVEKMGVGDSEGGPFAEVDYTTELDIYRQTLKQLRELGTVDKDNIFIFGHSMGGAFGPMIACEMPVKGIAVYGTASRTWYEYLLDTIRYQGLVAGDTFENADENVRQMSRLMALLFHEDMTVDQVKKSHPQLAPLCDAYFPGGLFNGKTLKFWNQLGKTNFAAYWTKCNARVLAVRGESDFVTYDADHKLIADIVNRVKPGWGRFEVVPASDHLFHGWKTEAESQRNFSKGTYSGAFSKLMLDWINSVIATKD